jgi:hypothetical protein
VLIDGVEEPAREHRGRFDVRRRGRGAHGNPDSGTR